MNLARIEDGISAGSALAILIVSAGCFIGPAHVSDVAQTMVRPAAAAVSIAAAQLEHFAAMIPAIVRVKRVIAE